MSGFDVNQANTNLQRQENAEKSAFDDNDDGGDLSSDIDGDAPKFDMQMAQSSGIHSFRGVD